MVTYFRQALALDERRVKFQPEFRKGSKVIPADEMRNGILRSKEVWFLGVHTSVGGGHDPDDGPSLSNIPFRWMLWEAVQCGLRTASISMLQSHAFMSIPTVQEYVAQVLDNDIYQWFDHLPAGGTLVFPTYGRRDPEMIARIRQQFGEAQRRRAIHLAALYDTALPSVNVDERAVWGFPTTSDLLSTFEDSLSGPAYLAMDYAPMFLQRRRYVTNAAGQYVELRDRWWVIEGVQSICTLTISVIGDTGETVVTCNPIKRSISLCSRGLYPIRGLGTSWLSPRRIWLPTCLVRGPCS